MSFFASTPFYIGAILMLLDAVSYSLGAIRPIYAGIKVADTYWNRRLLLNLLLANEEIEGIDIHPATGVALASLLKAVQSSNIDLQATTLLNITGGGWKRKNMDQQLMAARPTLCLQDTEILSKDIQIKILGAIS